MSDRSLKPVCTPGVLALMNESKRLSQHESKNAFSTGDDSDSTRNAAFVLSRPGTAEPVQLGVFSSTSTTEELKAALQRALGSDTDLKKQVRYDRRRFSMF